MVLNSRDFLFLMILCWPEVTPWPVSWDGSWVYLLPVILSPQGGWTRLLHVMVKVFKRVSPSARIYINPLLVSHSLMFLWPKQVICLPRISVKREYTGLGHWQTWFLRIIVIITPDVNICLKLAQWKGIYYKHWDLIKPRGKLYNFPSCPLPLWYTCHLDQL